VPRREGELQQLVRRMRELEREQEQERKRRTRYGVFVWREDARYRPEGAVKVYRREVDANKYADANYVLNYVVRPFTIEE